jgi:hypothetical protein
MAANGTTATMLMAMARHIDLSAAYPRASSVMASAGAPDHDALGFLLARVQTGVQVVY